MSICDKEYEALRLPKDQWRVIDLGNDRNWEISVGHTSEPHGFISWGWYGRWKIKVGQYHAHEGSLTISRQMRHRTRKMARTIAEAFNEKKIKP